MNPFLNSTKYRFAGIFGRKDLRRARRPRLLRQQRLILRAYFAWDAFIAARSMAFNFV
jgi:hypothetical protein